MKRLAEISLKGQPGAFAGSLMNSSADLVARACQGDQEAFRLIFERYSRPLISFVYDQVGNRELAEELTQETFVRAYKNLKALRDDTKLSTWLFGIAKNVARESLRYKHRETDKVGIDDDHARPSRFNLSNSALRNAVFGRPLRKSRARSRRSAGLILLCTSTDSKQLIASLFRLRLCAAAKSFKRV